MAQRHHGRNWKSPAPVHHWQQDKNLNLNSPKLNMQEQWKNMSNATPRGSWVLSWVQSWVEFAVLHHGPVLALSQPRIALHLQTTHNSMGDVKTNSTTHGATAAPRTQAETFDPKLQNNVSARWLLHLEVHQSNWQNTRLITTSQFVIDLLIEELCPNMIEVYVTLRSPKRVLLTRAAVKTDGLIGRSVFPAPPQTKTTIIPGTCHLPLYIYPCVLQGDLDS